jgi:hypothetical protein
MVSRRHELRIKNFMDLIDCLSFEVNYSSSRMYFADGLLNLKLRRGLYRII